MDDFEGEARPDNIADYRRLKRHKMWESNAWSLWRNSPSLSPESETTRLATNIKAQLEHPSKSARDSNPQDKSGSGKQKKPGPNDAVAPPNLNKAQLREEAQLQAQKAEAAAQIKIEEATREVDQQVSPATCVVVVACAE
jgi:hypothetical protein